MTDGWAESAEAWIASLGEAGDYGRQFVLDPAMEARVTGRGFKNALDVGCGEGRFCRKLKGLGIPTVGIDPTQALLAEARRRDPDGDYGIGMAEHLDFADGAFDLVVSYLTFIDIPDIAAGIAEMVRVLRPGGTLLVANLNSFNTAGPPDGWRRNGEGEPQFCIDHYLDERVQWVSWRGVRVQNWHRPLSTYLTLLLGQGLELTHFAEPEPVGGDPAKAAHYRRVPFFCVMEWRKPA